MTDRFVSTWAKQSVDMRPKSHFYQPEFVIYEVNRGTRREVKSNRTKIIGLD